MRATSQAALLVLLILLAACRPAEKKSDVPVIRMATILGRIMNPLSAKLAKVLPDHYPARLEVQRITNSGVYAKLLETGQIELAMIQTDLAYVAYSQGLGDSPQKIWMILDAIIKPIVFRLEPD